MEETSLRLVVEKIRRLHFVRRTSIISFSSTLGAGSLLAGLFNAPAHHLALYLCIALFPSFLVLNGLFLGAAYLACARRFHQLHLEQLLAPPASMPYQPLLVPTTDKNTPACRSSVVDAVPPMGVPLK